MFNMGYYHIFIYLFTFFFFIPRELPISLYQTPSIPRNTSFFLPDIQQGKKGEDCNSKQTDLILVVFCDADIP